MFCHLDVGVAALTAALATQQPVPKAPFVALLHVLLAMAVPKLLGRSL